MLQNNPKKLAAFQSDMGQRMQIAAQYGKSYELFSNTPIPDFIKNWLTAKGIPYTELLK